MMDFSKHKFNLNEWQQAIQAGEAQIKQGMMIVVQGELLIERANKEIAKFPVPVKKKVPAGVR